MKKTIHRADSRGYADHGWLKTHHTFSFANYYNPERVRFGVLRVLNDDIIAGGMGFGTHPHDNMEIVTIPISGALAHKDSTGTKGVIKKNEVQIMSAGSGLTHSEFNNSETEDATLLQIWLFPKLKNIEPRYDQKEFSSDEMINKWKTVVSPEENSGALWINQDAAFSIAELEKGKSLPYTIKFKGNGIYVFLIEGEIEVEGEKLKRRDAIGLETTNEINIKADSDSRILLIDLPMN